MIQERRAKLDCFYLKLLELVFALFLLRKTTDSLGEFTFGSTVLGVVLAKDFVDFTTFSESLQMMKYLGLTEQTLFRWIGSNGWMVEIIESCIEILILEEGERTTEPSRAVLVLC